MLTPDQIRQAAIDRLRATDGSCNATQIAHTDGVLRGLIWALTGTDPGTSLTVDILHVFQLLGVDAEKRGERVFFSV